MSWNRVGDLRQTRCLALLGSSSYPNSNDGVLSLIRCGTFVDPQTYGFTAIIRSCCIDLGLEDKHEPRIRTVEL